MMRSLVRSRALRLKSTYGSQATDNYPNGCPLPGFLFLLSFDHRLARKRVHYILFAARPMLAIDKGTWTYKVMFVSL
ncbi:uncharacterized protein B0T23DRAFT_408210 [Neurospora hispaniola]|uniref:Uncharacterized protein n=1 Tax=Neurospora hispaniola TaxID=588809 RepID=A0AAJ0I0E1_9PEZI|nr:hypothetical protein B0T23DRAFT_408210 [Neurospora hispaniola]